MRVEITIEGHQHHEQFVGEVLAWGQTVTFFGEPPIPMQVPCVVVKAEDGQIRQVPLQAQLRWVRVREIA